MPLSFELDIDYHLLLDVKHIDAKTIIADREGMTITGRKYVSTPSKRRSMRTDASRDDTTREADETK